MKVAPVAFVLSGGPGCGGVMELTMNSQEIYLLEFPTAAGRREVWAYRFANRSTTEGWVLEAVRWVGFRGMPWVK